MKHQVSFFSVLLLSLSLTGGPSQAQFSNNWNPTSTQDAATSADKLVYADFEKVENGRAVSNGGGLIQIYAGQESTPVKFKGVANASPGAPELVRVKADDPNHLASFEYNLLGPNQWANVTLEIQGHPTQNGQTKADDVSGYKHLSLQLYATGVDSLRVEFLSNGQGLKKLDGGYPQLPIRLKPGLNTYLIPLKGLTQPSWQQERIDTKELLKKLTAISISTYCNQCTPQLGTVVVDNLVFQK